MAKKIALYTDWVCIGKAGKTIDGRTITPEQLTEAAENYDPEMYTAVINNEHYHGNYGTVVKLRTGTHKDGQTKLEAQLSPNFYMLWQNADKRKLFTSMELMANFQESGKTYLTGLALTDKPASLGTTELHFSVKEDKNFYKSGEELQLEVNMPEENNELESLIYKVIKKIPGAALLFNQKPENEDNEMTEEQAKMLNTVYATVTELKETVTQLSANQKNNDGDEDNNDADKDKKITELSAKVEDLEGKLKSSVSTEDFNKLKEDFENAKKAQPGTSFNTPQGSGEEFEVL